MEVAQTSGDTSPKYDYVTLFLGNLPTPTTVDACYEITLGVAYNLSEVLVILSLPNTEFVD